MDDFLKVILTTKALEKKGWVGLTDEESGAIMEELDAYGTRLYEFARVIEAKLKEKNCG